MTDPRTINPFAGHRVVWTFQQHLDAGRLGGTDYLVSPAVGFPIAAAAAGTVTRISATEARLTVTASLRYNYRELRSFRTGPVALGEVFAESGRLMSNGGVFGPHIDAEAKRNGVWVREPFEPHVNSSLLDPAGGTGTPITEQEEAMYSIITNSATGGGVIISHITGLRASISSAADAELLQRVKTSVLATTATPAELDTVRSYLLAINPPASASSSGLTTAEHDRLFAIPYLDADTVDEAELGAAETSAVNLTNAHTDAKFDGLTLSTP